MQRNEAVVRRRPEGIREIDLGEDGKEMRAGLAKLTLTVMDVLRQVLERQALRRVDSGLVDDSQVERLGLALMALRTELGHVSASLGVRPEDLAADNPLLGSTSVSIGTNGLVDLLDRLLERGALVAGRVKISVADVDLVGLDLLAMLYPIYGKEEGFLREPVGTGA